MGHRESVAVLADLAGHDALDEIERIFREDPDGRIRRDAAAFVVQFRGKEAEKVLVAGPQDPSPGVRYAVCEHLGVVGSAFSTAPLRRVAQADPHKSRNGEHQVREAAEQALRKLGIEADVEADGDSEPR